MSLGSLGSVVSHGREGDEEMGVVFGFCELVFGWRCGFGLVTRKQHACFFSLSETK